MTLRTHSLRIRQGLFLAVTLAAACAARAVIPEPDAVVYGHVAHRFDQALLPSQAGAISVIAQVDGTTIASATLAPGSDAFLLRLPMDDGAEPRQPNTAKGGDRVRFFIRNNQTQAQFECVQTRAQARTLPTSRAPVVALNLSVEDNVAGVPADANHNGIPDFWETHLNLTVTTPAPGQIWSNSAFTVRGSVNSSNALSGVWFKLNGADWAPALTVNGYTNWMANVTLTPGLNLIRAYSMDDSGNCSLTNTTSFVYAVSNLFTPLKGAYSGLFYETNGVTHETSGFFNFTLTDKGIFSGRLLIGGGTHRVTGRFDTIGRAQVTVPRKDKTSLTVSLELDLTPGDAHDVSGNVGDGAWTAALAGDRTLFNARYNPAPQAGNYTLVVPGSSDSTVSPGGDGIGVVKVSGAGSVSLSGTLADGAAVRQSANVLRNGSWPLYASLYSGKGSVLGWVTFSNQPSSSFSGNLSWIKTAAAGGKYYTNGFSSMTSVVGSQFVPSSTSAVLNLTNGIVVLSAGDLSDPLTNNVTLTPDNRITVSPPAADKLILTVSRTDGRIRGSFLHPQTGLVTSIKAVVLQQQNSAPGFFLGANQSGRFLLGPE